MAFYIMFGLGMLPYIGKPLLAFWVSFTIWRWSGTLIGLFHPHALMSLYGFTGRYAGKFTSFLSFYFFGGMAAGFIFARANIGRALSIGCMAVSLIILLFMLPVEQWGATYTLNPMFILAMGGVIGANILGLALLERHAVIRLGRKAAWAALAGAISYPLYLLHGPILMLIYNVIPLGKYQTPSLYVGFVLLTGTVLGASILVALLYDQPIQRALRRLGRKAKGLRPLTPLGPEAPDPR
jgi:peptidoglycan/LPS O-acetylase OafA/YrhL